MELTQKLECTQKIYENYTERSCPEQIGYLGICGKKYPVRKGLNKIGRDYQICNIVLDLASISRQHAVLNVLSNKEYTLMDMDSANKTILEDKALPPYIPHSIKNGDTVQFGHAFGVFRLLDDENDLPMTQVLDIPETPLTNKCVSKINHITTIPESPEVSDRDESFIGLSQSKTNEVFKSPKNKYAKAKGKPITIQPIGLKKIDNVFWNSSRKSDSFDSHFNNSVISEKSSITNVSQMNIHDLETQVPDRCSDSRNSIYEADTQIPENPTSPNIYGMETQVPETNIISIGKISDQLASPNKVSNNQTLAVKYDKDDKLLQVRNSERHLDSVSNIHHAETQEILEKKNTNYGFNKDCNFSDEDILFDEFDCASADDYLDSQPILPPGILNTETDISNQNTESNISKLGEVVAEETNEKAIPCKTTIRNRLKSDSSTDCEDIYTLPTQKVPNKSFDITKNASFDELPTQIVMLSKNDEDLTDCEDEFPNVNINKKTEDEVKQIQNLEDLNTQILTDEAFDNSIKEKNIQNIAQFDLEYMQTQIIEPVKEADLNSEVEVDNLNMFKVPILSPKKSKKRYSEKSSSIHKVAEEQKANDKLDEDSSYYSATQDILDDLLTQSQTVNEDVVLHDNNEDSNSSKKERKVRTLKKISSEGSDVEITPKKHTSMKFIDIDLPDSEEIKISVSNKHTYLKPIVYSSDSDSESNSQQGTPILFKSKHRKSKNTNVAKRDLSKKFDNVTLPSRIITRVRQPSKRLQESLHSTSILKTALISEQEECIDSEIIKENLSRLQSKKVEQNKDDNKKNKTNGTTKGNKREKSKTQNKITQGDPYLQDTIKLQKEHANVSNSNTVSKTRHTRGKNKQKIEPIKTEAGASLQTATAVNETTEAISDKLTRKRPSKTDDIENTTDKLRRSKRQLTKKPDNEPRNSKGSDISVDSSYKKSNKRSGQLEQSAVYNMTFARDSFQLERSVDVEFVVPPKRMRPARSSGNSRRATPAKMLTQYVLFTAFPCNEIHNKLKNLGAVIVTNVKDCTVVLTSQIKRTCKLLCAFGLGKPIVGPNWVQACVDTSMIVDPWLYLLKDETAEKRYGFKLEKTLASKRNFLKGCNISATPNVSPPENEMKLIVECSGGTWKKGGKKWICVSVTADKALWAGLKNDGATVVSKEFILCGVLRQELDIDSYILV
ncbi:uncharacterized protein LOC126974259 [Leptidea sinapis]|uniref:uncharacterized protein LOC126974259 n=1 Tax=Leptidea sinapis TaxID=189913 RepID=UPI0021C4B001|nr:uncharacterized protein LOC126974259 [Leptidea sinapis]